MSGTIAIPKPEPETRVAPPAPAAPRRSWLAPSVADLTFLVWAVVIAIGFNHRILNGDGDIARHLRLGTWMLDHRALVRVDSFSHTAFGRPFTAYEWLSEILFAGANRIAGLAGVTVFAALLLALTYFLVVRFMQRRGVDVLFAYLAATAAALFTSPHWMARPHLFTYLCAALLLPFLVPSAKTRAWLAAPLFCLWANLHPGFFFGLALLGVFLAADAVDAWLGRSPEAAGRARFHGVALAAGVVGSLATPSGVHLFTHIAGLMGNSFLMDVTEEFKSPDFHNGTGKVFLAAVFAVVAALAYRRRRPSTPAFFAFLALAGLAFLSQRNIPLFGVVAFPVLAIEFDGQWRRVTAKRLAHPRRAFAEGDAQSRTGIWSGVVAIALVALALGSGRVAGFPIVPDRFDPETFPVHAVERARAAGLGGRMFNEFVWGGYLLWAWPEQRVFIDGATDFYGADLARSYMGISSLQPGWREALRRRAIGLVLMPAGSALTAELAREPGWSVWYRDEVAELLVRSPASATNAGAGR